jgi:periplasmic divalent cation tolerance protein
MPTSATSDAIAILCTAPDAASAERIAAALVEERLAACVNLAPGLTSYFRWEGKVQREAEVLLVIKTRRARFDAVAARVRSLHPYTVPELIALPIEAGTPDYLAWLAESTAT